MSDVKRIYVEKRTAYATEANEIKHNLIEQNIKSYQPL